MRLADRQAQRFNREYIGTEHFLLGVLIEGNGVAADVLRHLGLHLHVLRLEVEKIVHPGPDMVMIGKLPQTPRLKKAIEYAFEEARALDHGSLNTGHLLLGLLREQEGAAALILNRRGVRVDTARAAIRALGGTEPPGPGAEWPGEPEPEVPDLPLSVRRELEGLSAWIEQFNKAKELAVVQQDFEDAANLRERAERLHRAHYALVLGWRASFPIERSWLSWQGGVVGRIATQIHDEQRWADLPVLADALEEAGCSNQELLEHCRLPGAHGGRCWVVDLVLGEL
jgi:hypothetical protein